MADRHAWLVETRRALHRIPEFAFEEVETSAYVRRQLEAFGLGPVRARGGTGCSVDVGTGRGPVLGLRADMDALRIDERPTDRNRDYRSTRPGMMHACGHDAHVAIALCVARELARDQELRAALRGTVRIFFQPAEEVGGGAERMVADGVLNDPPVDTLLGLHVNPTLDVGDVGLARGEAFAACDRFTITIEGRGGHGSQPSAVRDPIIAGAYLVTQLQTIVARWLHPLDSGVLSIGRFEAGRSFNVIPDQAVLEGTVRALKPEVRLVIESRMRALCDALPVTFDLPAVRLEYVRETPPGYNDPELADEVFRLAGSVLGADRVRWLQPMMGAEDFALYARTLEGAPRPGAPRSCFFRLGCRNKDERLGWDGSDTVGLHCSSFDLDERALDVGVEVFLAAVRRFAGSGE